MSRTIRRRWVPSGSPFGGRRARVSYDYEAYLPDPISDWDAPLRHELVTQVLDAEAAIQSAARVTFQGFEALARHLLRAESVASSRIEGLVLSHRRLAEAAFDPTHADETARSVLANIAAMERAVAIGAGTKSLSPADVLEIHRVLLAATRDAHLGGSFRTEQNWIGGRSDGPAGAEFVPPPEDLVPGLIDDLVAFCNRDDVPSVVQAAVAHAQIETIHPFVDGNGRVGRCLVHVILRRRGAFDRYVPPVSLVLAGNATAYVRGLRDFRRGDVDAWLALFTSATRRAAQASHDFAGRMAAALERWRGETHARRGSHLSRAIDALPALPVLDAARLRAEIDCSAGTAHAALDRLAAAGIVSPATLGRRNRVFVARGVIELLNDFERRLLEERTAKARTPPRPPTHMPRAAVSPAESGLLRVLTDRSLSLADLVAALDERLSLRSVRGLLYGLRSRALVRLTGRARTARWSVTAAGRDATKDGPQRST